MIKVVCGVIENELGQLLIARRPEGKSLGGFWEFPGGKIEEGESPEAALRRELQEELLIETEIFQVLPPVEHHYHSSLPPSPDTVPHPISILLIPCRARIVSGVPHPTEHSEIAWRSPSEIDVSTLAPADIPILRSL